MNEFEHTVCVRLGREPLVYLISSCWCLSRINIASDQSHFYDVIALRFGKDLPMVGG